MFDDLMAYLANVRNVIKKYRREHYLKHRQKYIDKADVWRKQFRSWWNDYKKQYSCPCGENDPCCIDFHHTDDNKERNVAEIVSYCDKQKLLEEVEKCIPLCANCHRKLHRDLRNNVPLV